MEISRIDPQYQSTYSKGAEEVKPQRGDGLPPKEAGQAPKEEGPADISPNGDVASQREEVEKMREKVAERVKEYLRYQNWTVDLFIHKATQSIVAKIVDNDTGELIKQIPPEEVLNLKARFMELIRKLTGREEAEG